MASTTAAGPGGFSYAQAARGKQQSTASAAAAAAAPADMTPTKDWAEELEATTGSKVQESIEESQDTVKSSITDRIKVESKHPSSSSGVSSPDVAASATSHDDVSSSTQNGSSLSSWEAKSQSSDTVVPTEPAWIAERKERQSTQKSDTPSNSANTTTVPEQKTTMLHEAPLPTVNPWAKRAEEAKAKTPSHSASKPMTTAPSVAPPVSRAEPVNPRSLDAPQSRPNKHQSKSSIVQPPPVKDEVSWPTPETSQEERKSSTSHAQHEEKADDDSAGKPRKKQEWKPVAVVPNIIWETPGVRERTTRPAPNGDRAPRGGAGARGRGGSRGAANAAHGDRSTNDATPSSGTRSSRGDDFARSDEKKPRKSEVVSTETNGDSPAVGSKPQADATHIESKTPDHQEGTAIATGLNGMDGTNSTRSQIPEFTPAAESRKDSKEQWVSSRGARRGRGRGGRGDLINGHAYAYTNGHPGDFASQFAPPFATRGGHQGPYNGYGRAGARVNGARTHSHPEIHRYATPYMQHPQYAMPMFSPGFADFNGFMAPTPDPAQAERMAVVGAVIEQVDYYFSVNNLRTDNFLRKNMDSQGFVFLEVIAAFPRMQHITTDIEVLKDACITSATVDIYAGDDNKLRLRRANDWQEYILPSEDRLDAARNDGPQRVDALSHPPPFAPPHLRQYGSVPHIMAPPPQGRGNYDYAYSLGMQMSPHTMSPHGMSPHAMFIPEFANGVHVNGQQNGVDEVRGRDPRSSAQNDTTASRSTATTEDADVFPDDKIAQLTVCVMMSKDKDAVPQYNLASRTFSNGSIDTKVVQKEIVKAEEASTEEKATTEKPASEASAAQDFSVFWIKDNDKPVESLPSNLTPEPYFQLHGKAIEQRNHAASGTCPYDLDVLYQFWSHFLIRNFNNSMYSEFVHLAHDDAAQRLSTVGQDNLVKFYDEAIKSTNSIPLRVAQDYAAFAHTESKKENSNVFESMHRTWRDGALNLRNRKRVSDLLDSEVKHLLEG
ncbi:hypothetical protein AMS68_007993 [Peltaster fructicola]|uniref:HTH La-type RNA-binding domain-containing protein n=1 Tax=Peltaster fructicola TaxID=286661 RepID=A0A6H0Y659_9PEZI|nr:hypothetical protein AMS68_007993 [Peltaster fructicola]